MNFSIFISIFLLVGCANIALMLAPEKSSRVSNTKEAKRVHQLFWDTFHSGQYDQIDKAMIPLKAEYLNNPHDPQLAAHIGFLHIWKLSERYRLKRISPSITDNAIL